MLEWFRITTKVKKYSTIKSYFDFLIFDFLIFLKQFMTKHTHLEVMYTNISLNVYIQFVMHWIVSPLPKFIYWNPNSQCACIWSKEVTKVKWGHKHKLLIRQYQCPPSKKGNQRVLSLFYFFSLKQELLWTELGPPKSHVKVLTLKVVVFEDSPFRR